MSLLSHIPLFSPFFPFLPSLASQHNFFFFFFLQNSDLSGNFWVQARPFLQSHSLSRHTQYSTDVQNNRGTPAPVNNLPNEHAMRPSMEVLVKLFPKSSPGFSPRWTLDGTLSLPTSKKYKGELSAPSPPPHFLPSPPLDFMFRSGLGTDVNQMYSNPTRPHFPQRERETFTEKRMQKCLQDVRQLLFVKFDEKWLSVCIYSRLRFMSWFSAWRGPYLHEWQEKKNYKAFPDFSLNTTPISVSTCCLLPAKIKIKPVHTGASFTVCRFIVYFSESTSQWAPFKEAVISGILCRRSAGARSRRFHLIDSKRKRVNASSSFSSSSLAVRSGPPLRALGLASDKQRRIAGSPKVRQIFFKVPGPGPEWFGVCFLGTGVLYKYFFFFLNFLAVKPWRL